MIDNGNDLSCILTSCQIPVQIHTPSDFQLWQEQEVVMLGQPIPWSRRRKRKQVFPRPDSSSVDSMGQTDSGTKGLAGGTLQGECEDKVC